MNSMCFNCVSVSALLAQRGGFLHIKRCSQTFTTVTQTGAERIEYALYLSHNWGDFQQWMETKRLFRK